MMLLQLKTQRFHLIVSPRGDRNHRYPFLSRSRITSTARQSHDAKRISDGQIQLALELYLMQPSYPSTPSSVAAGSTATIDAVQAPWTRVSGTIASSGTSDEQVLIVDCGSDHAYRGYGAGAPSLYDHSLASTLERSDNTVLAADADSAAGVALELR